MSYKEKPKYTAVEAFEMGYEAYLKNIFVTEEPSDMNDGQKDLWRAGWNNAELETEDPLNQIH